jgi:hypothetical protein
MFNTRHLACVTCKEKFVVSEGITNKRREIPSVTPNVSVRYEDDRQQLPVVPSPHSAQEPTSIEMSPDSRDAPLEINCPRCGTDNRNWLYLNTRPSKFSRISLGIPSVDIWVTRMSGIFSIAVIAILFLALIVIIDVLGILPRTHTSVLFFAIPFATGGIFWDMTHKWKQFREDKHRYNSKITTKKPESALLFRGLFLIFFFSLIVPLLFISILPRGFKTVLEIVYDPPEGEINEVITDIEVSTNQRLRDNEEDLQIIAREMQELLTQMPAYTSPQLEQELDAFSKELDAVTTDATIAIEQSIADGTDSIEAQRIDEMASIAVAKDAALTAYEEDFLFELRFLVISGGLLGISTLITFIVAFSNLQGFIKDIDAHLPLPIFYSVAGMTRLVTWEAKQALEIQGNLQHIQWMSVNRNEEGGIDLEGLFRDPPELDGYGRPIKETVRAQRHIVKTDLWGRIIEARIEDVIVLRPAGAPTVLPVFTEAMPHDAPQTQITSRPSNLYLPVP